MGYVDDIRAIAKTKELEEKIAKVIKDLDGLKKSEIGPKRSTASQTGDSSKTVQTGEPPASNPIVATLPTGAQQTTYPAGTPLPGSIVTASTGSGGGTSALTTYDNSNSVDRIGSSYTSDLSARAISGSNPGGSDLVYIASRGAGDSVLTSLIAGMASQGVPLSEQEKFIDNYIAQKVEKKGVKTAKEIADNSKTIPQPNLQGASASGYGDYNGQYLGAERINSVVGFVEDGSISPVTGEMLVIKAQLNGLFPTPNSIDTAAAGQYPWADAYTPKYEETYTPGAYWKLTYGFVGYYGNTFNEMITAAINPTTGFTHCYAMTDIPGIVSRVKSASPVPGDLIAFTFGPLNIGDLVVGGVFYDFKPLDQYAVASGQYGQMYCDVSPATICSTPPSLPTAWPQTGTFVVSLLNGFFNGNPFDSERPFKYDQPTSSIRMKVGDGVNIIDDRYLQIESAIMGGYLISTIGSNGVDIEGAKYFDANGTLLVTGIDGTTINSYRPR